MTTSDDDSREADLLVFGDTANRDDKLILFVGREPNNDLGRRHAIGTHPFSWQHEGRARTCPFWNNAYGLAARTIDHGPGWLKAACLRGDASPIAFTDLSPISLDGSVSPREKRRRREAITVIDYEQHLGQVFSHALIRSRVELVIATGIVGSGLDKGIPTLERVCKELELPLRHVHSLSSTHRTHVQRLAQLGGACAIVRRTLGAFMLSHAPDLMSAEEREEHATSVAHDQAA